MNEGIAHARLTKLAVRALLLSQGGKILQGMRDSTYGCPYQPHILVCAWLYVCGPVRAQLPYVPTIVVTVTVLEQ
jgi:hypothetical protein